MKKELLVISIFFHYAALSADPCENRRTCSECITDSNVCVWCAKADIIGNNCKSARKNIESDWCPGFLQDPKSTVYSIEQKNFSSDPLNVVQITPQNLHIKLRVGQEQTFNFSYKAAANYPVDMYFLLDVSLSMKNIKNDITRQSKDITETMERLTPDIRFGLGTFIDKNVLPFTRKVNSSMTYSFRNEQKLINDKEVFFQIMRNIEFGENYDDPEGGLDALGQVLACTDVIGWRRNSRKIIIFLTNYKSHAAGDGIIAGIIQPYDGKCYTDSQGIYTKEKEMDYPSVSMINKLAANIEATVVFVVPNDEESSYYKLSKAIRGSKSTTFSGKRVDYLLKSIYEEIRSSLQLNWNIKKSGQKKNIELKFYPDCTTADNNNPECFVTKEEEKQFSASIKLLEYTGNNTNIPVEIVIGGVNERLQLNIAVITKCDCDDKGEASHSKCNRGGTLKCGLCECDADRYGEKCACTTNMDSATFGNDNSSCIAEGTTLPCTGRGTCICGTCHCTTIGEKSKYEGKYCECDKDSCPRYDNALCSNHGTCTCGKCLCNSGWNGEACQCSKDKCTKNNKVCNDRGECECNRCKCPLSPEWDARDDQDDFCVILPCEDCHKSQCLKLKECAVCLHQRNIECKICEPFKSNLTEKLTPIKNTTWNVCSDVRVDVGCYTQFMYRYVEDAIELVVQTEKDCQESYYVYGSSCLVTLILIGIATFLAWKLITDARDRREYLTFMKKERKASVRRNPLYNSPNVTTQNPTYDK